MKAMSSIRLRLSPPCILFNRPPLLHPRLLKASSVSFSSCTTKSDDYYSNQSRGGLPRFFSQLLPSSKGSVVRIQGDEFWHMTKVLRLSTSDRVELFNGKGGLVEGCIQNLDRSGLDFLALEDPKTILPQTTQWHVFAAFGTLKGGRADWLVEKCTELGASSVTPLLTERSSLISENRVDRLQRVILAATKQCQRVHEMTLNPPTKIDGLLPFIGKSKLSFIALAEASPLISTLASCEKESIGSIIIGPEGDFTQKEVDSIKEAGATAVGLGPHRLRAETATIALLSSHVPNGSEANLQTGLPEGVLETYIPNTFCFVRSTELVLLLA